LIHYAKNRGSWRENLAGSWRENLAGSRQKKGPHMAGLSE
jgi:hypothetical protein